MNSMNDVDAIETREWLDALDSVDAFEGVGRVDELLSDIVQAARRKGAKLSFAANSAYVNTIPPSEQPAHPGDRVIEHRSVDFPGRPRWCVISAKEDRGFLAI